MPVVKFIIRDRVTGAVRVNLGDRLTKLTGTLTTTIGQAGSVTVPGLPQDGDVWFTITSLSSDPLYQGYPAVNLSGSVISWEANSYARFLIHYGRY